MKKSIKLSIIIALILLPTLIFTSCGSTSLPEGFDQDEVTVAAKDIINNANNRDYETIYALIDESLQGGISVEQIQEGWDPLLDESGDFVDFDEIVLASKNGDDDIVYALALVKCNYENGKRTYTFYFNEDMTLSGLWMK